MLIQVDIDSTLYDSDAVFKEVAMAKYGIDWPLEYYQWFGPEYLDTDLETLLGIFYTAHSAEYCLQQTPYPDAVDTIKGIVRDFPEVEIAYISDRNPDHCEALREWLDTSGFLVNDKAHVEATKDKRHWMRERKPEIVIDDRVRTILMARYELGSYVIGYQHTHNINLMGEAEHIYIVPTWKEIDGVLRDIILPRLYEKSLSKSTEKRYAIA